MVCLSTLYCHLDFVMLHQALRLMNSVMGEYIDEFILVYLDDLLVFNSTEHEHENHLRLVF